MGGMKFFEQAHLKDVVAFLKIIQNPQNEIAWTRVLLLQPHIGQVGAARITNHLTGKSLETIINNDNTGLSAKAIQSWRDLQELFKKILKIDSSNIAQIIETILEDSYTNYIKTTFENAPKRIEDIEQLINFSDQYNTLNDFLSDVTLSETFQTTDNGEPKKDEDHIVLSTIHQAKGLEWNSVFVLHLASGQFPHSRSMADRAEFEEERRLFYVATTRAKQELYLLYPITLYSHGTGMTFTNPSEFIRELDPSLYDEWSVESGRTSGDLPEIEYLPEV